jgi:hypothetical protein
MRKSQGHSQYRLPKSLKVVSVYIKVDAGDYWNVSLHLACIHIFVSKEVVRHALLSESRQMITRSHHIRVH